MMYSTVLKTIIKENIMQLQTMACVSRYAND